MRSRSSEPLIRPQPKIKLEPCNFRIDTETLVKLQAYADFIQSEQGYVIREALNHLFQNDHGFQVFLASRPFNQTVDEKT